MEARLNLPLRIAILSSPLRTQIRLAAATGIPEARLSRIVNGWAHARADEQTAIAAALGKPLVEVFGTGGVAA